jgi:signal transduction histidine kinase
LLSGDLTDFEMEVRVRQVLDLAKQTPVHAIGNVGNAMLLAAVFWHRLPHLPIVIWLTLFIGFSIVELVRWQRKRHWAAPARVSRRAIGRTTFWAFFAGLLWMAAIIYVFPHDDMPLQLLVMFLAGGLGAGAVASMPSQPVACAAYMLPPLGAVLVLIGSESGYIPRVITAMGTLYVGVLLIVLAGGFSSFVTIIRTRIDSRDLATRLLEAELAASTEANRAKSQFLTNMSHELRTPLNAVIGFSELIRDQSLGPDALKQYCEYASDIHEAGQHLLRIIDDLLDISKIEAGRLALQEGEMEIAPAIAAARKMVSQAAADIDISIDVDLPSDLPALRADEARVRQILLNLLSNAVKFSHRSGHVKVGAVLRPDGDLAISISDQGIGMTQAEIDIAMKPFSQVDASLSRRHEGLGLGLPLVNAFVELHGGRLELASEPAVGTTATVIFPARRVLAKHGAH